MTQFWIILSTTWNLQDVQAGLNVVVSLLSAIAIFTFARWSWQKSTMEVARQRHVPLSKLLSLSSPGEVWDVFIMLRSGLFSEGHLRIFLQCFIVLLLSVSTIMSGPLSRYSTRRGTTISKEEINGLLAAEDLNSIGLANVQWNQTIYRLQEAGFPYDQLLDFLPDSTVEFKYVANEWNNSWTATCETLPLTHIDLGAANSKVVDNSSAFQEIPKIYETLPLEFRDTDTHTIWENTNGYYTGTGIFRDNMLFIMSTAASRVSVNISIVALHLKDAPAASDSAYFASGPIPYSSFTRVTCRLTRSPTSYKTMYVAFPWTDDPGAITQAYSDYYSARFMQQSSSGSPVTVPNGTELFQFYQVYMVTKDTWLQKPVVRKMSIYIDTVEISVVFLACMSTMAFFILLGSANYLYFYVRHYNIASHTPMSKLDWMLHSIKESDREPPPAPRGTFHGENPADIYDVPLGTRRSEFASAMYGPSPEADGHGRVRRTSTKGYFELFPSPTLQRTPSEYLGNDPSPNLENPRRSSTGLGFLDAAGRPLRVSKGYFRMSENET